MHCTVAESLFLWGFLALIKAGTGVQFESQKKKKKDMKTHKKTEVQGGAGNQGHTKRGPQQQYFKKNQYNPLSGGLGLIAVLLRE